MSPIHDQTYRHYAGVKRPPGRAWTVIASAGVRGMMSKKAFIALLLVAWIPFVVYAVGIYATEMYPQARSFLKVDASMFKTFISNQGFFIYFITVYVGAGLIANDRRANALQIYLSKPLMRADYIGGKLAVLATFITFVTLVPGLMLLLLQIGFAGNFTFINSHLFLVPSIILSSLLIIVVASVSMLALSSLSKSSRYCAVLYTGVIFFGDALFGILRIIFNSSRVSWVSIGASLDQVTDVLYRQTPRYETPWGVSLLVLMGIVALSLSVLERRVRGVEVVS